MGRQRASYSSSLIEIVSIVRREISFMDEVMILFDLLRANALGTG